MSDFQLVLSGSAVEGNTHFTDSDDDDNSEITIISNDFYKGENGAISHTTSDNPVLDLFFILTRDFNTDKSFIQRIRKILSSDSITDVVNFIIITFQTRNCRGGKGEKDLFLTMFREICIKFPNTALELLSLIPNYGCWKDLLKICNSSSEEIRNKIVKLISDQLKKDIESDGKISLAAKWCPRENEQFHKRNKTTFYELVREFTGSTDLKSNDFKQYRKAISSLSRKLDVTEIKMCENSYSTIDYRKVPSVHLHKWRKAHLNEKIGGTCENEDGNRYPDRIDRVNARHNLLSTVNIHGGRVDPHMITSEITETSIHEQSILERQWNDIRREFLNSSKRYIPISDVSGSMSGIPMEVSIALGILLSEISHDSFKDKVLTFHESPSWVDLKKCTSLAQKVTKLRFSSWGGSTNLIASFQLILDILKENSVPNHEVPDLIIFSDMQFDQIHHDEEMETHLSRIDLMFSEHGYTRPRIIFWNLRATRGLPAKSNHPNVILFSGYSPSLLKYIIEDIPEITPETTFNQILNDKMYDEVRKVLSISTEGILSEYTFEETVNILSSEIVNNPSDETVV